MSRKEITKIEIILIYKYWIIKLICTNDGWQPTPVLFPGKPLGQRGLVDYSPWGRKESDTTEWFHFHFRDYKHLLKIKLWGFCTSLASLMSILSLSLSPSPSLSFSGWSLGTQRLSAFNFLPGLLRPTREGAQGGAPSTIQAGTCGLREQSKSLVLWFY